MLHKSSLLTLETIGYSLDIYCDEYCIMGPRDRFTHVGIILDCLGQVYAGTKETLPDFLKRRRVARHPLVFRGFTGSQRTPGFWGVTAWYQSLGIRIPRETGLGIHHHYVV